MIYRFRDCELDTERLELRRAGVVQPLEPQVFRLLAYLIENRERVVTRNELYEKIWNGRVVAESALYSRIKTARAAIGDEGQAQELIRTVSRTGYQFVAGLEESGTPRETPANEPPASDSNAGATQRRRKFQVGLVLGAVVALAAGYWFLRSVETSNSVAAPAVPSIAVLPFVDMSPAKDQAYFADGIAEEIINSLAQVGNLRVIARTSSFAFRDHNADITAIRRELGVTHVLEGSVRKSGDQVRVTVQLIDASTHEHVWSRNYDRKLQDIFDVQSSIASAVSDSLHLSLADTSIERHSQTRNAQAFEHYLQGRFVYTRRGPGDLEKARKSFEEAVRLDPGYASAWAGLAATYYATTGSGTVPQEDIPHWRDAAIKAVATGPNLAEAQMRAAQFYWSLHDYEMAMKHFERAKELNPLHPLVLGALMARANLEGRTDDGVVLAARIVAIDPVSAIAHSNLGMQYLGDGHYRKAIAALERARELSPGIEFAGISLCTAYLLDGRPDDAAAVTETIGTPYWRDQCRCLVHDARGESAAANQALENMKLALRNSDSDPNVPLAIAEVYATRGMADDAFQWLEMARQRARSRDPSATAESLVLEMRISPFLISLRTDPRWEPLILAALEGSLAAQFLIAK